MSLPSSLARITTLFGLALGLALLSAGSPAAAGDGISAAKPPLKAVRKPLVEFIATRRHIAPDTLAKFVTSAARTTQFRALMNALVDRDWTQVTTLAGQLSYDVVTLREARIWYVVAYDRRGRDPIVVINLKPRRELIVGAPHVPFEPGTGEQAMILLRDVGGRAGIVSGAHRCASATHSTCDGTTSVCGSLEAYRDSDPGHNDKTLYHIAHVVLAERWPNTVIMSLHGMTDDNDGVKTSMIVSNGIKADDDSKQTAATRLRALLGQDIKPNGTVVSCNLSGDDQYAARALCGQNNVQGRLVNGDADVCHGSVTTGSGRFIHLEQDRAVRDPYADDWQHIGQYPIPSALTSGLITVVPKVP